MRQLVPGHSRLNTSQLLDYCHATISSGKACHSPELLSAPLSSVGARAATLDGGCTRQAALGGGRTPLAASALLLRRLPGEAWTQRKGGSSRCRCHVVSAACCCRRRSGCGCGCGCVCVCRTPADPSFPELSTSSLYSHGRGESGPWCCRRSAYCPRSRVLISALGKNLVGKRAAMCEQIRYQPGKPLLSKHCHLNHVAGRICGSYLSQARLPNILATEIMCSNIFVLSVS